MMFEEIYQQHWDKVYRLCRGYVGDPDWANDIAQDTFVTVWQQLPSFRNEASVGTWIFRIASNHCLRQIERSKRMPAANMPVQVAEQPTSSREHDIQLLHRYIGELNETDRLIILLELEDMKQADIAAIVGISEANTRVRIHRIKEKLSQKFRQNA